MSIKIYMLIATCHIIDLIFSSFISEAVKEVSSEESTFGSRLDWYKYGSLLGGTYFKSIDADLRYKYKLFNN